LKFPVYIEIGSTKILLHVVFEVLAFFIGFRYFLCLRKKRGDAIRTPNRTWILIGAIFGALIGSRLIGGLEDPTQLHKADNLLLYFYQKKQYWGVFWRISGVELVKRIIKEKKASGDFC
jgi:hypothetical protein